MATMVTEEDIDFFFDISALGRIDEIDSPFARTSIKSVIDEALNQLSILRHVNTCNFGYFDNRMVHYQSIEDRISGTEKHENTRLPAVGTNQDKLAHDVNTFINIFRETIYEIDSSGTYKSLKQAIKTMKRMDNDAKELFQTKENYEKQIITLKNQIEEERITVMKSINQTNEQIQKIRFEVEDIIVYGKTELEFLKHYEAARTEQNLLKCKIEEKKSVDVIEDIKEKIELEQKCHKLFLDYIVEDQEDLLEVTNYWTKTYYSEVERKENELMKLKGELDYNIDTLDKLTKKFNIRQAEIDKWMEYKEMKRAKEDRVKQEIRAIATIQAWWRGTMCRRGIPPGGLRTVTMSKKSKKPKKGKKKKKET